MFHSTRQTLRSGWTGPNMEQMKLEALADFVLVASHGGFGKASRATGRPKATLSRKVAELETELGMRLVERGARALRLTGEGEALYKRTRGLLAELVQASDDIRGASRVLSGSLRISAPVLFAHVALSRIAAEFARLHPQLRIEISADDRFVDPVEDSYDIVVRTNPRANDSLVGRRFLTDKLLLVAPPDLPRPAGDAFLPAIVLSRQGEVREWVVVDGARTQHYMPDPRLRLSSIIMVHSAVRAGAGAAILPQSLVAGDLATGILVSWGAVTGRPVEVWALHTSQRLASPKVTAFMAFLVGQFPEGSLDAEIASAQAQSQ